jgi:hypothetical protein
MEGFFSTSEMRFYRESLNKSPTAPRRVVDSGASHA